MKNTKEKLKTKEKKEVEKAMKKNNNRRNNANSVSYYNHSLANTCSSKYSDINRAEWDIDTSEECKRQNK